jgi:TolB protein
MPAFSPDGAWIAFEGLASEGASPDVYRVPSGGGTAQRLTDSPANDSGPAWAPDGRTLYFVSDRGGSYELWSMAPDGSNQRVLTSRARVLGRPAVSPDGRSVAYAHVDSSGLSAVEQLDLATGVTQTLSAADDSEPAYSPDGTQLALTTLRFGNAEVVVLDLVQGGPPMRVTDDPTVDGAAAFAPAP